MLITNNLGYDQYGYYIKHLRFKDFVMLKEDPSSLFNELATDLCQSKIALVEKVYGFPKGYVMKHLTKEFWGISGNF